MFETGDSMKLVRARAVMKRRRRTTARARIAWVLSVACMAVLLGACGQESPEASSPKSPASTSPTKTVAPSPQKIATPRKKRVLPSPSIPASAALHPGRCVAASPTTHTTSPALDADVCQVIIGYTWHWVVVEAKVDPTSLSQGGTSFRGYFDAPSSADPNETSRYWEWKALFPVGVRESRQLSIFNPYGGVYGCGSQGMGRGVVPTGTVNRERGIIKVVFPSRCIGAQGLQYVPPTSIRASANLDPIGTPNEVRTAYFTDRLFPGDVAVQRR
jgi:hypothetical protein